ncbi:hypothetical protein AVEN_174231-1 [Araneus ventricosus]|uniref:Uncharacterized protein n=2 Tax=Araneus ventricosus TaxID=182803 RepID=A0A4Y2W6X8_ARAVE|nr:hypothetical protein AVEN_78007-1 [Araneus ventricosus]GBO32674.1 hypothetical protein AVEN_174231-1 [Araneus ventricosus]
MRRPGPCATSSPSPLNSEHCVVTPTGHLPCLLLELHQNDKYLDLNFMIVHSLNELIPGFQFNADSDTKFPLKGHLKYRDESLPYMFSQWDMVAMWVELPLPITGRTSVRGVVA